VVGVTGRFDLASCCVFASTCYFCCFMYRYFLYTIFISDFFATFYIWFVILDDYIVVLLLNIRRKKTVVRMPKKFNKPTAFGMFLNKVVMPELKQQQNPMSNDQMMKYAGEKWDVNIILFCVLPPSE